MIPAFEELITQSSNVWEKMLFGMYGGEESSLSTPL